MNELFRKFAEKIEALVGTPWAFFAALFVLIVWATCGPFFGFSESWQLIVNSFTTIVTFLIVFLIQNTQTRDFQAIHLKLDELIRVSEGANPGLINLQELSDDELQRLEDAFRRLRERSQRASERVIEEIAGLLEKKTTAGKERLEGRSSPQSPTG